VFSHFSSSEEDKRVTAEQQYIFGEVIRALEERGFSPEFKHIACSASTLLYKQTHENAVRPGIALYGLYPSISTKKTAALVPILSFKTKIIACKTVGKGTAIGYGQSYVTSKSTTIATLPIGYFDGFDRGFSNTGEVLIHGVRCRVRGRVCMNLTMVEVPKSIASHVKIGDEVVVLGAQKRECITAEEWAQKLGTISYEVVTRLGAHIPRIVVGKKSIVTST
jgi:alanine racemase